MMMIIIINNSSSSSNNNDNNNNDNNNNNNIIIKTIVLKIQYNDKAIRVQEIMILCKLFPKNNMWKWRFIKSFFEKKKKHEILVAGVIGKIKKCDNSSTNKRRILRIWKRCGFTEGYLWFCQTSLMSFTAKIVHCLATKYFHKKHSITDFWQGPEYVSDSSMPLRKAN